MPMKKLYLLLALICNSQPAAADFQAGAIVMNVSPLEFPVFVNGGMSSRSASVVNDPINARAMVLSDGKTQIAIVVVDSCMMARPVLDQAKKLASKRTGIPTANMLISATHTHTAPASMGCLGTKADPRYTPYLIQKLAAAIAAAQKALQPAQIGWNSINAAEYTALRRWVRRPDMLLEDPFGNPTGRAQMHSGRNWNEVTGESGPEDPDLNLISVQTREGKPLALLANFSMHYFGGVKALSADYFGRWANNVKQSLAPNSDFVPMMSHGCSGDIWRRDYAARDWTKNPILPEEAIDVDRYAKELADRALQGYEKIQYRSDVDLAMAETRMRLDYRTPNKQLLEWAERIVKETGDRAPKTSTEVYALEQTILHQRQNTEIVVQALRIGDIAITTTPNETYALTALKLKAMSPLKKTMVIELANGGDGYIPPPEQHVLGGYNTWAARTAGLEPSAEPRIAEACIQLLEKVSGEPRRTPTVTRGPAAKAIANLKPIAWWRMDEFNGPRAVDEMNRHDGIYETQVAYYLAGPHAEKFTPGQVNRATHFVGQRMQARLPKLGKNYSVSIWFWNGMPNDSRAVLGWMFSRGRNHARQTGEHLGLNAKGQLIFQSGAQTFTGKANATRWQWPHAVLVRDGDTARVYLPVETLHLGGRNDNESNWEGRLDEAAVFDRALSATEVKALSSP